MGYGDLDVPNIPPELHGLSYTKLKDYGYSSICAFYDECQEFEYEDYMRVFSEEFESGILRSRHSGDHTKNKWNSDYYSRTENTKRIGIKEYEWLPNAWPPDYLLTADSPPKGNDDTSFIPYAMVQKHVKTVNRTFYSPRKTFLWYTGELHANETRNGIKVDYEVRSKREAGF